MDCKEIEKILPRYFNHTASEEEIKSVEEHLCICHKCRVALGKLMDQLGGAQEPSAVEGEAEEMEIIPQGEEITPSKKKKEPKKEKTIPEEEEKEKELQPTSEEETMEYFPGKDIEEAAPTQGFPSEEKEEAISGPEAAPEELVFEEKEIPAEKEPGESSKEISSVAEDAMEAALTKAEVRAPLVEKKEEPPAEEKKLYPLDEIPLEKPKADLLGYIALGIGIVIFIALIYLLIKG